MTGIPHFVKKNAEVLCTPITHLINLSIRQYIFPNIWKSAIVTPIYKAGNQTDIANYRPISILPIISKIMENVVTEQLVDFLNTGRVSVHPMQFGFRKHHSTETAICYFIEQIKSNLDEGGVVGAVFLDLSKAFDTVNHNVLLSKLSYFHFSENVLQWTESYLEMRKQCTRFGTKLSPFLGCSYGVPQGSILRPLTYKPIQLMIFPLYVLML